MGAVKVQDLSCGAHGGGVCFVCLCGRLVRLCLTRLPGLCVASIWYRKCRNSILEDEVRNGGVYIRMRGESKYGVRQDKHYSRLEGSWGILQRRQFLPE